MLKLALSRVRVRAWSGFKGADDGFLPPDACWLQPDAAEALKEMQDACGQAMTFQAAYTSVSRQLKLASDGLDRDHSRATQNGHNFGMSLDVAVGETLSSFLASKRPDLMTAGRDQGSLARWMRQFGWQGVKAESGHFDYLAGHETVLARIESLYDFSLDNVGVQRALNKITGGNLNLDGVLDRVVDDEAAKAYKILGYDDKGAFSARFRRLLAGATAETVEV